MKSKYIHKEFWVEAISCAVYLSNRSSISLQETIPQEVWSGRKPTHSYLRVFGCVAYAYIVDKPGVNLEDKN